MARRRMTPAAGCALLVGALFFLATCSNPIDFNEAVEDEVKTANDKYLEVVSVSPAKGELEADPSSPLVIEFDRAIDTAAISSAAISIAPTAGGTATEWTWSFNTATNELSITPTALEAVTSYTITIASDAGLAGSDGSAMRDPYAWSFTTKNVAGGNILIDGGAAYSQDSTVDLTVTRNAKTTKMRYRNSTFAYDEAEGTFPFVDFAASVSGFALASGEGLRSVYYQFYGESTYSPVLHSDITVDWTPPAAPTVSVSSSTTALPTWTWSTGGGGNGTYHRCLDSGTLYTVATTSYTPTSLSYGSAHSLVISERDAAGNWSSDASASFTPSIYPLSGASRISRSPTIYWPDGYSVTFYFGTYNIKTGEYTWSITESGITEDQYALSSLNALATYYWKYVYTYYNSFLHMFVMVTKGPYSFTTGK